MISWSFSFPNALEMKGGFYGLRGKEISLILIALVCTSILIWAWENTPLLATFLPPQSQVLQLSPETPIHTPMLPTSRPYIYDSKNITKLQAKQQNGQHSDFTAPSNSSTGLPEMIKKDSIMAKPIDSRGGAEIRHTVEEEATGHKTISNHKKNSKQEEQMFGEVLPAVLANTSSSAKGKACNFGKGKWVKDSTRPFYSGFGCKQWLSSMWACRLTQRRDFEYEKFRWKPKTCEMKKFTGSKFLKRMKDKTLAFIGDSLGRQQFQSLMCMVTAGKERSDVLNVGKEYGLIKARGAIRPDGWAYRFPATNTTILYYWSASLCDITLEPSIPSTNYAMHLDRPPAFLRRFLHKFDVLVLNTGHHWNRGKLRANRWIMYTGGMPNTNGKIAEIGGAKNFTIYSIVKWVNLQLPKYPGLKAFYRSISPRHFFNGDWNTGGTCDNLTPLSEGKEVSQDESVDVSAAGAVKGTDVKLLDITSLSQLRDEGHISRYSIKATPGFQDCLHWCLPGIPDTWNEILFAQI